MITILVYIALIGLMLSIYATITEYKVKKNVLYKPMCDISDKISCSQVFSSPYGKILGIPYAYLGLLYYTILAIAASMDLIYITFTLSSIGFIMSLILAYILYFKIKILCIVCVSLYIINIIFFILNGAALLMI